MFISLLDQPGTFVLSLPRYFAGKINRIEKIRAGETPPL
jgi:hypothetical protein